MLKIEFKREKKVKAKEEENCAKKFKKFPRRKKKKRFVRNKKLLK